jgi:hypothetical protein
MQKFQFLKLKFLSFSVSRFEILSVLYETVYLAITLILSLGINLKYSL